MEALIKLHILIIHIGHGNLVGGSLHDLVSTTGSGFVPTLNSVVDGYVLTKTGNSASWSSSSVSTILNNFSGNITLIAGPNINISSGSNQIIISGTTQTTQVTGSSNFFVTNTLKVSGSIVNPIGDLILSGNTSNITVSGNLNILKDLAIIANSSFTGNLNVKGIIVVSGSMQTTTGLSDKFSINSGFTGTPFITFNNSSTSVTFNNSIATTRNYKQGNFNFTSHCCQYSLDY